MEIKLFYLGQTINSEQTIRVQEIFPKIKHIDIDMSSSVVSLQINIVKAMPQFILHPPSNPRRVLPAASLSMYSLCKTPSGSGWPLLTVLQSLTNSAAQSSLAWQ